MGEEAENLWRDAKRLRKVVREETDQAMDSSADENHLIERFDKVENLLALYRRGCVSTVFVDFEYASKEQVDDALWQAHVQLIRAYRQSKDRLSGRQLAVIRHKVVERYVNFLKLSQLFYRGYIQRLAARYHTVPELHRALRGVSMNEMDVPDKEHVDAAAAKIEKLVIASAYRTLVYLGDLARYRTLLRAEKERKFNMALAYYSLAIDVDPNSGSAYHQMAVIFREDHKHLDVVYCLFRSLVAERAHPQAVKNLGVVFKDLLRSGPPKAGKSHEALQFWFPRLHAHFDRGEVFSQHNELEKEVMGRFDAAVKAHDFGDGLLKVILVNICAYEVASNKIKAEWTEQASRSCQFIMRLSIQMIQVISGHVESELTDLIHSLRNPSEQTNGTNTSEADKTANKFSPLLEGALPLLRVYMTWLCMYRSQIVDFQAHLMPYLPNMYKTLSRALTKFIALIELLQHDNKFKVIDYLFTEDTMTLGLEPLNGPEVPDHSRLAVDSLYGRPKPRFDEDSKVIIKCDDITYTRAVDITYRAFVLAKDVKFPFALTPNGSAVLYLEEGKGQVAQPVAGTSNGLVAKHQRQSSNKADTLAAVVARARSPATVGLTPKEQLPQQPASQKPASQKAASQKAASQKPASQKTASQKPAPQKPAPQKPAPQKPAPQKPSPKQPSPKQPSPNQPLSKQPISQRATPKPPTPKQPSPEAVDTKVASTQASVGKPPRQPINFASAPIKPTRQPLNPPSGQLETNFHGHRHHPSKGKVDAANTPRIQTEADNSMDESHVYDIVKDFLEPREPREPQPASDETSYGMHTDTARNLFESVMGSSGSPAPGPTTAPHLGKRLSAQWDRPTGAPASGWVNPTLTWYGMSSAGPQQAWPTNPGPAELEPGNGEINGYYGQSANHSGLYPSAGSLAPGTHWRQHSRETSSPAQLDPWRRVEQPRQTSAGFGPNPMGGIKSLEEALAAQLGSMIPNRSPFSPPAQMTAPHGGANHLPAPGSFASTNFAFSQTSSRPQMNSPWGMGNNWAGGYTNQGGATPGNMVPPPGFGTPRSSQQGPGSDPSQNQQQNGQDGYAYGQYYNNTLK